jgi:iron complex outermembrane recepter protein
MRVKHHYLAAAIASSICAGSFAQDVNNSFALEEIIVTAQKRAQSLQEVPVSVNVVSGENIAENGINNLDELSNIVPNLTITEGSQSTSIFIRGLGSGVNQGFEQSVGMFIDGIYAGRDRQFRAPFLDVENVEVLRGPQGTLFGKNTIAGALNITTAKPSDEFEALLRTTYEPEYNDYAVEAVVSGPLSDSVAARLAVRQSESDGHMENTANGRDEPSDVETVIRATVMWDASDDVTVTTKIESSRFDVGGEANNISNAGTWAPLFQLADSNIDLADEYSRSTNLNETSSNDSDSITVNVDWQLGDYTLTSISGYSGYEYSDVQDVDFTPVELLSQFQDQEFSQLSQEIRLTSPLGDTFDFIAGAYWQTSELKHHKRLASNLGALTPALNVPGGLGILPAPTPADGSLSFSDAIATVATFGALSSRVSDFDQDSETWALFASGNWHFFDSLHITAGLRYTEETKEADRTLYISEYDSEKALDPLSPLSSVIVGIQSGLFGTVAHDINDERTARDLSPSLKVSYDLNDDTMIYASVSRAFKSGGFDEAGTSASLSGFSYDEEEALAFEIGAKMTLLEGAATLNIAAFETQYDDLQVSAFATDRYIVGNAAQATTRGVEMDGMWRITESLTLSASMAYLDAKYEDFQNASCTAQQTAVTGPGCVQDLSGKALSFAPEWAGNIGLNHFTAIGESLELRSNISMSYTDEQYLTQDLDKNNLEDSSLMTNVRIALADIDDNWEVALVGKNITDEEVISYSNDVPLMNGAYFAYRLPPRTVALQAVIRY